jgi:hypothetical protein
MTAGLKIRQDARNRRRERLARREKRAMQMLHHFHKKRLLSVLSAFPQRPIITVVPLAVFLTAIKQPRKPKGQTQ